MLAADHDTRTITLVPLVEDRPMRRLRDPEAHSAVARLIPPVAAWLEVLEPISDAVCTTNPIGGRGIALALRTAADLADVLIVEPDDPREQALGMDNAVTPSSFERSPRYSPCCASRPTCSPIRTFRITREPRLRTATSQRRPPDHPVPISWPPSTR